MATHSLFPEILSADQLLAADVAPREPILEPIIAEKTLAMLYGPRGQGKTFVAMGIAWAVASGGSFLRWRAPQARSVVYIDGEMAAADMKERLRLFGPAPANLRFMIADLNRNGLPDLASHPAQLALLNTLGELPDLLVLDNLSSLVGSNRNDPDSWNDVQGWLMAMRRAGMAVLAVHHANKKGNQRGTSRREDVLDVVIAMRRPVDYQPRDGARFELHFEKARGLFGDALDPIEARLSIGVEGGVKWDCTPAGDGEFDRAVKLLVQGMTPPEVARTLGISRSQSYRLRERAAEMGLLGGSSTRPIGAS